jgi:hypothetical protein
MAKYSGECFCGAVRVEASGEPEATWDIAIADHAVRGQVDRSMLSPSGNQMP